MIVHSTKKNSVFGPRRLVWLTVCFLLCSFPVPVRSQTQTPITQGTGSGVPDSTGAEVSTSGQQPDQQPSGSISGKVVDQSGATIPGARVKLTREDQSQNQEVLSDDDGQFSFANIAPGHFEL